MSDQPTSRYGIMEKLNHQKIEAKKKKSEYETELDAREFGDNQAIAELDNDLKNLEQNYEFQHKQKVKELEVQLKHYEAQTKRRIEKLKEGITEEQESYKENFEQNKIDTEKAITLAKENLKRFSTLQEKKISDQGEIIKEIDEGINDLKEVSAGQEKESKAE